jgi:Flp pilus assembly protein TadD
VRAIRAALDDTATEPRFLETLPRRGYRWIAPVTLADSATGSPDAPSPAQRRVGGLPALVLVVPIVLFAILGLRSVWTSVNASPRMTAEVSRSWRQAQLWMATREPPSYDALVAVLDTVVAATPDWLAPRIALAEALIWANRTTAARRLIDSLAQSRPANATVRRLSGTLAIFREGRFTEGLVELQAGARRHPVDAQMHHMLACALLLQRDTLGAEAAIARALHLDPLAPVLAGDVGMVYWLLNRPRRADSLCRVAQAAVPNAAGPGMCRALAAATGGWGLDGATPSGPDLASQLWNAAIPDPADGLASWLRALRSRMIAGDTAIVRQALARDLTPLTRRWAEVDPLLGPMLR